MNRPQNPIRNRDTVKKTAKANEEKTRGHTAGDTFDVTENEDTTAAEALEEENNER